MFFLDLDCFDSLKNANSLTCFRSLFCCHNLFLTMKNISRAKLFKEIYVLVSNNTFCISSVFVLRVHQTGIDLFHTYEKI